MRLLVLATALLLASCSEDADNPFSGISYDEVTYEVRCVTCSLTMSTNDGGTSQIGDFEADPDAWTEVYKMTKVVPDTFVYISAQNSNGSGSVAVRIVGDGKTLFDESSTGAYVIATASGSID